MPYLTLLRTYDFSHLEYVQVLWLCKALGQKRCSPQLVSVVINAVARSE